MKNTIQKGLAAIVMFVLVVSCFAAVLQTTNANPTPVAGNPSPKMDWDPAYVNRALTIEPYPYDRGNAAGDKIPSNAHSADYPGIYFYWNDKQREDGVLLVDPFVFTLFKDETFTVTAKTSNCYWGHVLSADDDFAYDAKSGLYIYNVFRNCMYADKKGNLLKDDMKNINMIFIDGIYKEAEFEIKKTWLNEDCDKMCPPCDVTATFGSYKLGINTVKFTDYKSAYYGKTITVTEGAITGFKLVKTVLNGAAVNKATFTVKINDDPINVVEFKNQKQMAEIELQKAWLNVEGVGFDGDNSLVSFNDGEYGVETISVKEGIYTFAEDEIEGFTLVEVTGTKGVTVGENNVATVDAKADGKYTVTFTNQEIEQPQVAYIHIIKNWAIDGVVDEQNGLDRAIYTGPSNVPVTVNFKVDNVDYDYDIYKARRLVDLWYEVTPGSIVIREYDLSEGWDFMSVTINGQVVDKSKITLEDDGFGFVDVIVTLEAVAGEKYDIEFVNNYIVPHGSYYVSVISGADFGYEVKDSADRWAESGWGGFGGQFGKTIGDYWMFTWTVESTRGYLRMLEIAGNEAIYGKSGIAKDLLWVWGIEDGITICWETQAEVQAGVPNPLGGAGEFEYYTGSVDFEIDGTDITFVSDLYFAADNAAEIFINGESVKLTTDAISDIYGDWNDVHNFRIYKVDATDYADLLVLGTNTVSWVARNDNITSMDWNPCGIVLAFEIFSSD